MNKKLFVLLPAALLMLASCGENPNPTTSGSTSGSDTSQTTGSSTSSEPVIDEDYGTAEHPLSVTQFMTNVAKLVPAENEAFSVKPFFVVGTNDTNATMGSSYLATFYLKDADVSVGVKKAVLGDSGVTELGKNDTVLVKGYAEYYGSSYSIYGASDDADHPNPEVLNVTRGVSAVTVTSDEHSTITSTIPETATNGTVLDVTVTTSAGYKVDKVTCNGAAIEEVDGKYPCKVMGPTTIAVTSILDIAPIDVEDGTYKPVLSNTNSGLSATAGNAKSQVALKADTETVVYKKLNVEYTNCRNQDNYGEVTIEKGGNVKIETPTGKIKSIKAEWYKSQSCLVRAGAIDADEIEGTQISKEGDHLVDKYAINNSVAYLTVGSGSSYTQSFYNIEVEVLVGEEKVVNSLAVTTPPTKVVYTEGESFDKAGMVVTATYSDSTTENVTADCTVTPSGALVAGTTKVTLSYGGKTVEQAITVNPAVATAYTLKCDHEDYDGASGNGNYAAAKDRTVNGVTWSVMANLTLNQGIGWAFGGKNITNTDRTLYSKTAITSNINKVEIDIGNCADITVNSATFSVHSSAADAETGANAVASFNPTISANSTVTINKADSTSWADCYYRFVLNVTVGVNSNKRVEVKEVRFFA